MRHPMSLRNPVSKSPVSRYPVIEPYTSAKQTHILKKALNIRSVASLNKRIVSTNCFASPFPQTYSTLLSPPR